LEGVGAIHGEGIRHVGLQALDPLNRFVKFPALRAGVSCVTLRILRLLGFDSD
jgi:hypothetical protein